MAEPLCSAGDQAANLIPPPLSLLKVSLFAVVMWRFAGCSTLVNHSCRLPLVRGIHKLNTRPTQTLLLCCSCAPCWYAAESVPLLFAIGSSVG